MAITTKHPGSRAAVSAARLPTIHTTSLLEVCNVVVTFGGVVALDRVSEANPFFPLRRKTSPSEVLAERFKTWRSFII